MRNADCRIDPHLVRHGDVGAARIGRDQRAARLPEVAFGIEMQHLWAHAGIARWLQDAAGAATDWIDQRQIAERELVVAVGEPPPDWWTPLVSVARSGKVSNGSGTGSL